MLLVMAGAILVVVAGLMLPVFKMSRAIRVTFVELSIERAIGGGSESAFGQRQSAPGNGPSASHGTLIASSRKL